MATGIWNLQKNTVMKQSVATDDDEIIMGSIISCALWHFFISMPIKLNFQQLVVLYSHPFTVHNHISIALLLLMMKKWKGHIFYYILFLMTNRTNFIDAIIKNTTITTSSPVAGEHGYSLQEVVDSLGHLHRLARHQVIGELDGLVRLNWWSLVWILSQLVGTT